MPTPLPQSHVGNRLLAALSTEEYARIHPYLERVSFSPRQVIYESGERMEYIYFPTTSIVCLLYIMESGDTAEVGIVGREGAVGITRFMGGSTTPYCCVAQAGGGAFRVKARVLLDEFIRGGAFQRLLLRYTQALMIQVSQTALCNRLHTVEQQLCRLLLLTHDRVRSDELLLTQEYIAGMLGVRREWITHAARHLQDAGLISYSRGHIRILDRRGLESNVCECYRIVETEFERLLNNRIESTSETGRAGKPSGELRRKIALGGRI